jgi:hypothetical protein
MLITGVGHRHIVQELQKEVRAVIRVRSREAGLLPIA